MKLYLSSYLIGDHVDRLLTMAGGLGARMAVLTNAVDAIPLEAQLAYARGQFDADAYFASHGFDPSLIDLRVYAGRRDALRAMLRRFRVVWAIGGNCFLLRRAMRESGFDAIIGELLADGIVYAGWSAGACVAGDHLDAVALMDEPTAPAPGYLTDAVIRDGLGLVPFTIIPHVHSDHPEAPLAVQAIGWAEQRGVAYRTLRDGDVLIVDGGEPALLPRRA